MTFTIPNTDLKATRQQFPFRTTDVAQFVRSQKTGELYVMPDSPNYQQAHVAIPVKVAYPAESAAQKSFRTVDGDTLTFVARQVV